MSLLCAAMPLPSPPCLEVETLKSTTKLLVVPLVKASSVWNGLDGIV